MRQRPKPSTAAAPAADRHPAYLAMPNGSEVYVRDTQRLKGYVVNHAPGKNRCEAFDARRNSLGTGTQEQCMAMLNTPKAERVASEVFVEAGPRRTRGR